MTLPADKTGSPCMPGPRPATPFTETSSRGFPTEGIGSLLPFAEGFSVELHEYLNNSAAGFSQSQRFKEEQGGALMP